MFGSVIRSSKNLSDFIFTVGFGLTILGVILALVAACIMALSGKKRAGGGRGGGILLIGPIPIIFGTDRESVKNLILLAMALMVIVMIVTILPRVWR